MDRRGAPHASDGVLRAFDQTATRATAAGDRLPEVAALPGT
jgi:hypothetical protein